MMKFDIVKHREVLVGDQAKFYEAFTEDTYLNDELGLAALYSLSGFVCANKIAGLSIYFADTCIYRFGIDLVDLFNDFFTRSYNERFTIGFAEGGPIEDFEFERIGLEYRVILKSHPDSETVDTTTTNAAELCKNIESEWQKLLDIARHILLPEHFRAMSEWFSGEAFPPAHGSRSSVGNG